MEQPPVTGPKKPSAKKYAVSSVSFDRPSSTKKKPSPNAALARTSVSLDDIRQAVQRGPKARIHGTNYELEFGVELKLKYLDTDAGHIKGVGVNGVVRVETIKSYYEECGLAKLLAAAFYLYWQHEGMTKVGLGTNDTSRGFWGHLGVGGSPSSIDAALEKLGSIAVTSDLSRAEPAPEQDYTKTAVL
ncbi:MAG TPA: hypothetical protein VJV79_16295 [Polyangiaceae bacterium]|nr:hypothetical protein [Polyangiaceae bacterium]